MKAFNYAVTIIAAALLSGCGDKAEKQKVASMEARLAAVEAKAHETETNMQDLFHLVLTNQLDGVAEKLEQLNVGETNRQKMDAVFDAMGHLTHAMSNLSYHVNDLDSRMVAIEQPNRRPMALSQPRPAATKDGVPLDVYNAINAAAVQHWPGDYEMQAYQIKNQIEAYRKLHP